MKALYDAVLTDATAERVRRSHAAAIEELQAPAKVILENVVLADNTETFVSHKLGRAPRIVKQGIVRGASSAGIIRDFGSKSPLTGAIADRSKVLLLRTDGFGSTITVDFEVE